MKLREAIIKAANEAETRPSFIGQAWAELFVGSLEAKGFVIVPKEATEEMAKNACELDCTLDECRARGKCYGYDKNLTRVREVHDYLLAARPTIEV